MYTVRPLISRLAADPVVRLECPTYVTRPGYTPPSYPTLLRLYSLLRQGLTLHEWIEENEAEIDLDALGIDVRRFVSFGVIKGFLRRVHRYPILLTEEVDLENEENRGREVSEVTGAGGGAGTTTSRRGSALERVKGGGSGSREREYKPFGPPKHRDSDTPAMSGFDARTQDNSRSRERNSNVNATPPPPRIRREASEADSFSTVHDHPQRERLPSNKTASWGRSDSAHTQMSTSPTKRQQLPRPSNRSKRSNRHPTATVVDVATISLEQLQENQESRQSQSGFGDGSGIPLQAQGRASSFKRANSSAYPPSPHKRASFKNLPTSSTGEPDQGKGSRRGAEFRNGGENGSNFQRTSSYGPETLQSSTGGFESSRSFASLPIPTELPELLDGTHSDDELCVRFGLSWSELQRMLITIGTSPSRRAGDGRSGSGDREGSYSDDERDNGVGAAENGSTFASGYGNVSSASGFIRRSFPKAKRSSTALRGTSGNATAGGNSTSGWAGASGSRMNSSGWNAESEGAMNSGWASSGGSNVDQKALERGDYGRIKIILR